MPLLATFVAIVVSLMLSDSGWAQVPGIVTGPRPQARVIDETGTLSAADSAEIERLARSIQETTKADMMVVVIPTTAGESHRRFATDLKWMVASLRCGADYVCLIVSARYRHRGDLMNVIEQQIEVVGMQMATDIFRSTEYRPR